MWASSNFEKSVKYFDCQKYGKNTKFRQVW